MATINEGYTLRDAGILKARDLVDWKLKQGLLKVPAPPSKVIISPQLGMARSKQNFFSKEIKGLSGTHICIDAEKGIYLSAGWGIGSPALVATCEELHALGANEFYMAGVCGRLSTDIQEADMIVAASAIREEGTSQHYLPAGAGKNMECPDKTGIEALASQLNTKTQLFVTTDAPYRETATKYREWREQGAMVIDMETSALYAFGNFYNIKTYSVGVGADMLSADKWAMADNYDKVQKRLSGLIDNLIKIAAR